MVHPNPTSYHIFRAPNFKVKSEDCRLLAYQLFYQHLVLEHCRLWAYQRFYQHLVQKRIAKFSNALVLSFDNMWAKLS